MLLAAYTRGYFPMMHEDGEVYWHDPDPRAIIPLATNGPNRRLIRYARVNSFTCTLDRCFEQVIRACADREETWLNEEMIQAYTALHHVRHAHSVECWQHDELIGGIYGVSIGAAFFGESMFSRTNNASTWAFHFLLRTLNDRGYQLFDTQYINDHTRKLGAVEIPRAGFQHLLAQALLAHDRWTASDVADGRADAGAFNQGTAHGDRSDHT